MKTHAFLIAGVAPAILVLAHAPAGAAVPAAADKALHRDIAVCAKPVWPPAALARGATGKTTLALRIDGDGKVAGTRVDVSSGHDDLDQAAVAGVSACRFHGFAAAAGIGDEPSPWKKMQFVWTLPAGKAPAIDEAALRAKAEGGDAAAQVRLGWWYQTGVHGTVDAAVAEGWYRKAADAGSTLGQSALGRLLWATPERREEALHWFRLAARAGDTVAQGELARAYLGGVGVARDPAEGLYWLQQAAASGKPLYQLGAGIELLRQAGDDADRAAAIGWLEKAAAQGDPYGQLTLAHSLAAGQGAARDEERAVKLYRATLGRTGGQGEVALGTMTEAGRGTPADPTGAAALYRQAMAVPYGPAFVRYGRLLESGTGVARDRAGAIAVYLQAADLSQCDAMHRLGALYLEDGEGAAPKAYEWFAQGYYCRARTGTLKEG